MVRNTTTIRITPEIQDLLKKMQKHDEEKVENKGEALSIRAHNPSSYVTLLIMREADRMGIYSEGVEE